MMRDRHHQAPATRDRLYGRYVATLRKKRRKKRRKRKRSQAVANKQANWQGPIGKAPPIQFFEKKIAGRNSNKI